MKLKTLKTILAATVIFATLLASLSLTASAKEEGSHGLYMDPVVTGGMKFDAFMIDFQASCDDALATYWELAGFQLDTAPSVKALGYFGISGGGGYCGLQTRGTADDRVGIIAFWQYTYRDSKTGKMTILNAEQIYPKGSGTFGNEGSGVNWIKSYKWSDHQWYRMLLMCWTDTETGYTFAGTWYYDYEADVWTLYAYFNTKLVDSSFKNGFGQFIENYSLANGINRMERSAYYRNVYAIDHESGEWQSLNKVTLSSDNNLDCVGTVSVGISDDKSYVWEKVDGTVDDPNYKRIQQTYTMTAQPQLPTYGKPSITSFGINDAGFSWTMSENSTPMLSYSLEVTDINGNTIAEKTETRPEIRRYAFKDFDTSVGYKCTLTVTDVFGQSTTAEYVSDNYNTTPSASETPETIAPVETETSAPASETPENADTDSSTLAIIIIAVSVIGVAVAIPVVISSKKRKAK